MCLGIPGRILEIEENSPLPMAIVDFGGVRRKICLAYVADEVEPDDYVIVHVGFAIARVDEEEAQRTYEILREMSELDELMWMSEAPPPTPTDRRSPIADRRGPGEAEPTADHAGPEPAQPPDPASSAASPDQTADQRRSAIGDPRSAEGARRSAIGDPRSAEGAPRSAKGAGSP